MIQLSFCFSRLNPTLAQLAEQTQGTHMEPGPSAPNPLAPLQSALPQVLPGGPAPRGLPSGTAVIPVTRGAPFPVLGLQRPGRSKSQMGRGRALDSPRHFTFFPSHQHILNTRLPCAAQALAQNADEKYMHHFKLLSGPVRLHWAGAGSELPWAEPSRTFCDNIRVLRPPRQPRPSAHS